MTLHWPRRWSCNVHNRLKKRTRGGCPDRKKDNGLENLVPPRQKQGPLSTQINEKKRKDGG